MNKKFKILLLFLLMFLSIFVLAQNQKIKVIVLPADVEDYYDHKGCTEQPLQDFISFLKIDTIITYLEFPLGELIRKNINPYYIYNKKYCHPIAKETNANFFLMSHVKMVKEPENRKCTDIIYNIEIKVYSMTTNKEKVLYSMKNVTMDKFQEMLSLKRIDIINEIKKLTFR